MSAILCLETYHMIFAKLVLYTFPAHSILTLCVFNTIIVCKWVWKIYLMLYNSVEKYLFLCFVSVSVNLWTFSFLINIIQVQAEKYLMLFMQNHCKERNKVPYDKKLCVLKSYVKKESLRGHLHIKIYNDLENFNTNSKFRINLSIFEV